mmetsp:Transcript_769/g.1814  ORF Transcript_769/g.1814 Transcript_769/m.1814 type:complete len:298 (-) Transcript_769:142-1035(-)
MAALTSRMSRLMISSRFTSIPASVASTISPNVERLGWRGISTHISLNASTVLPCTITSQNSSVFRCLSSMITVRNTGDIGATSSLAPILTQEEAENFAAFAHANRHQKVKPFIIKRRVNALKTYIGNERDIRHSPWRMNLVCQFAAGQTVPEALKQLMFTQKMAAPLVAKVIRRTANLADIRHGLQPSQLEVAECFATHGSHLKRIKIMGRGRSGKKRRRFSHIRLVLREIDFPTKILQAETVNQKRRWLGRLAVAREDYEKARIEKDELAELEEQAAKLEVEARKKREDEEEKNQS